MSAARPAVLVGQAPARGREGRPALNGWPAGLFHAFGGMIAAGRAANEATFCEALRQALGTEETAP